MIGYIYALWNKSEDDIFYIGFTADVYHRMCLHRRSFHLPNLNYSIIDEMEFDYPYYYEIRKLETYWIYQFKAWGFNLINKVFLRNESVLSRNKRISDAAKDALILAEVLSNKDKRNRRMHLDMTT